jgi:hypothetical protein
MVGDARCRFGASRERGDEQQVLASIAMPHSATIQVRPPSHRNHGGRRIPLYGLWMAITPHIVVQGAERAVAF